MGLKATDKCIKKAFEDEMLFVLMARDASSPHVVIEWIKWNLSCQPAEKLHEALDCAIKMNETCNLMNIRKQQEKQEAAKLST